MRTPCSVCHFAVKTRLGPPWPVACHRHAPTTPLDNKEAACWPVLSPTQADSGCGDGEAMAFLCVQHGGSPACEEANQRRGAECPKCRASHSNRAALAAAELQAEEKTT